MPLFLKIKFFWARWLGNGAGIVTSRYDIILQVILGQNYTLLEFIAKQVAIEEVQTVESFMVYKGYNLKVPYLL